MSTNADLMIDRRRLRRKVTFWRIAALLVAAAAIAAGALALGGDRLAGAGISHIAKIRIEGTIVEDEDLLDRLEDVRTSDAVKGVILAIDSPGGTTAGGEAIFEAVRRLAADKPVVAQVGTLAASAGYMIASAADHIVARQSSIVGSIGVLVQFPNFTGTMEKLGIGLDTIKSSPLKAEPQPFNPTTDEERAMMSRLVMDSYDWFVGLVDDRRPLDRAQVLALADGSVFTGRQALANKLVDKLGGEKEAVAWLAGKGVDPDLGIVEWKPRASGAGLLFSQSMVHRLAVAAGLAQERPDLLRELGLDRIFLDGLLSVWHVENPVLGNEKYR